MLTRPDSLTDVAAGERALAAGLERCIAPAREAFSLPPACYREEAILRLETDAIFRRKWVGIGRADRFAAAGDYEALEIGGAPVIVLRDKDGTLRAFANSCRHRGARLLDGTGNCRVIRCPFHSWTYRLDGTLASAPQMKGAAHFDTADYGLVEFRTGEACGFAFLCLDGEAPGLAAHLGDFAALHAPWPLETLVTTRRRSFTVACNWKTFLDVFNEYCHLPFVHPSTIAGLYEPPEEADACSGAYASQYGKTEGTGGLLEDTQAHALPAMPGLDARADDGVRYTWVFPNMTFAASREALWVYEANPIDAQRCAVTQTTCFPRQITTLPGFEEQAAHYYHRMDAAISEDIPALENQQRGLDAPHARQGRFSPLLEASVAAFARWYAEELLAHGVP